MATMRTTLGRACRAGALALLAVTVGSLAGCGATSQITIPPIERAFGAARVPPSGWILKPEGAGPFPAVVLLHGCTGLDPRTWDVVRDWALWYRERGFVALILDSFGPRGLSANCLEMAKEPREVARSFDAYAALEHLLRQPFVDPSRVVVQGLSQGGSTVLETLRASGAALGHGRPAGRFRAGVALYPLCFAYANTEFYAPVLILIGSADDFTPAAPCEGLNEVARGRQPPNVELVVYPGVHHGFDYRAGAVSTYGRTVAGNPQVTREAQARIERFLRDVGAR